MSRILQASKRTAVPDTSPSERPDNEPILLDDNPSAEPVSAELTPPHPEPEVPFVEIPEPDEPGDEPCAAQTLKPIAAAIRFQSSHPESVAPREPEFANTLTAITRQTQLWQSELDALWEQVRQARVRLVLMVSAVPSATAQQVALTTAWHWAERISPILMVETPGALVLHQLLARPAAPGWTDWLAGLPLPCVVQATPHSRIHYLGPGNVLACVQHRYLGHDWQARCAELSARYPLVLLLATSGSAWAFALGLVAEAVCFVLSQGEPHLETHPAVLAIQAGAAINLGYLFVQPTY